MSSALNFDDFFYVAENPDVLSAVITGDFENGFHHFTTFGSAELRAPNALFLPIYYLEQNVDVAAAVENGFFQSGFDHYRVFGQLENRAPSSKFEGFNATTYLANNPDIAVAVGDKTFSSAMHHFIDFGRFENRPGTGIIPNTIFLTNATDNLEGSNGDDTFTALPGTLQLADMIDGKSGQDELVVSFLGGVDNNTNNVLPIIQNFKNLEGLSISADEHMSSDFSGLSSIKEIELDSGKTINGSVLIVTLGAEQALKLDSVKDGDTGAAKLDDGGIKIVQPRASTSLNMHLDDIVPLIQDIKEYIFIDVENTSVETLNVTSSNQNSIVLQNSGQSISTINFAGSGTIAFEGTLFETLRTINGKDSNANINVKTQSNGMAIELGRGNDSLIVVDGSVTLDSGAGDDSVSLTGGNGNFIETGIGDDNVGISTGQDRIVLGAGRDTIAVTGGTNTISSQDGDDTATLSGGVNTFLGGGGNDSVIVSGGVNTLETESDNDQIEVSGGTNTISSGDGNDNITLTGGTNHIRAGDGDDTVTASGGASNVDIRTLVGW